MSEPSALYDHEPNPQWTTTLQLTEVYNGRDFALALTHIRMFAGLSIRDLAKLTGIPSATLGGYFSGRHLPSRTTDSLLPILRACNVAEVEWPAWLDAWARVRRAPGPRPATEAQPYRGLAPFGIADAEWFFGREHTVAAMFDKITAHNGDEPAVYVLTGSSGSGKSSILRAGLAARFTDVLVIVPGSQPLLTLSAELARRSGHPAATVSVAIADPAPLPAWLLETLPELLVVDQAEELFTPVISAGQRRAIVAMLVRIANPSRRRTAVVLGLRSDFYQQAAEDPDLRSTLQDRQLLLGPMSEAELRSAIVEPARRAGVSVDDDLVELVLRDMAATGPGGTHGPGSLPLMSHALMEAWQFSRRGRLTRADYLQTGGIPRAAQQTAEEQFAALTTLERTLARRIFLRLVHLDDGQPVTRRRVPQAELLQLTARQSEIPRILESFVTSRLLTIDADSVELSHESLVFVWPRLAGWIEQDIASLRRLRQLTAQAQRWDEGGRAEDELIRGLRLEDCQRWLDTDPRWRQELNRTEHEFLAASTDAEHRRLLVARRSIRRTHGLLAAVTMLLVLSSLLATFALRARGTSDTAEHEAQHQRDLALSGLVAGEADRLAATNPALASQLALAAYRISPTMQARSALLDSVTRPSPTRILGQPGPTRMAISSDGMVALSNAVTGAVQLVRLTAGSQPFQRIGVIPGASSHDQIFALTFLPRTRVLATGSEDGLVRLWDLSRTARPKLLGHPLPGIQQAVESIAISSDGKLMAVGGGGSTVWLWDISRPEQPRPVPSLTGLSDAVWTVAFAPAGDKLMVGGEHGLLEGWRLTGDRPVRLPALAGRPSSTTVVTTVTYSPDGSLLVAGGKDGILRLWTDAESMNPQSQPSPVPRVPDWIDALAFAPGGRTLAVAGADNMLSIWSVGSWQRQKLLPHPGPVTATAFLADGSGILSASADGVGRLWQLPGRQLPGQGTNSFAVSYSRTGAFVVGTSSPEAAIQFWPSGTAESARTAAMPAGLHPDGTAAISPNGRLIAAGSSAGPVLLWAAVDGRLRPLGQLTGPADLDEYLTFSADSRLLAVASDDHLVHLWDVSDPARVRPLPALAGPTRLVYYVAFAPDGHTLAAASADNTVRLWDVSSPGAARPLSRMDAFASYAMSVTFSPDGQLLAASSADHLIRLWRITDRSKPVPLGTPLTGPDDNIFSIAISPDGKLLAAGSADHTARVWDISTPAHPVSLAVLRAMPSSVYAVAFSPDGATLAGSGIGGDTYLWPVSVEAAIRQVCSAGGDALTTAEWQSYIGDRPYARSCGS